MWPIFWLCCGIALYFIGRHARLWLLWRRGAYEQTEFSPVPKREVSDEVAGFVEARMERLNRS